jgi:hypothetical protein
MMAMPITWMQRFLRVAKSQRPPRAIWVESTEGNSEFEGGGSRWQKSLLVTIYL